MFVVGRHGKDGGEAEDAGAAIVGPIDQVETAAGREFHFAFEFVVFDEAFGEEGVFGGEEIEEAFVGGEDVVEEELGLFAEVGGAFGGVEVLEFGEERDGAAADFLRAEPLAHEAIGEDAGAGIVEHAIDLRGEDGGVLEFALGGEVEELVVGHGGPEEVREAGGHFVVADGADAGFGIIVLHAEEEAGGDENGFERELDVFFEGLAAAGAAIVEGHQAINFGRGDGAAVGAGEEAREKAAGGGAFIDGGLAGFDAEEAVVEGAAFAGDVGWFLIDGEAVEFDAFGAVDDGDGVGAAAEGDGGDAGGGAATGVAGVGELADGDAIGLDLDGEGGELGTFDGDAEGVLAFGEDVGGGGEFFAGVQESRGFDAGGGRGGGVHLGGEDDLVVGRGDDDAVEHVGGGFHVAFEHHGGDVEGFAVGVETGAAGFVGGEEIGGDDVETEEVADGVFPFAAVEATGGDVAGVIAGGAAGGAEAIVDPVGDEHAVRFGEFGGAGGHGAVAELGGDVTPEGAAGFDVGGGVGLEEIDAIAGVGGVVTLGAVFGEDGADFGCELVGGGEEDCCGGEKKVGLHTMTL